MYVYYQLGNDGPNEAWSPIQANQQAELEKLKPTFVTVLQIDTLLPDAPTREQLDKAKYYGPLYFDLDDKDDVGNSINDAKELLDKLSAQGVLDTDLEIFLSGKKGLHILVPFQVLMAKPVPTARLPAIYKEIAFSMAVGTMDFKVYTARKGRMLRTCYNIRENGNYRVPITADELRSLTPEKYADLCKTPRSVPLPKPEFRFRMGLEFDKAAAKLPKLGTRRAAPVDPATVQRQWSDVEALFKGEAVVPDAGFNKIAIQLALYGREAGWSEEQLVEKAHGIIQNHASDGDRYNNPWKRERELRRVYFYMEDNPAYEYSVGGLKALIVRDAPEVDEEGEVIEVLSSGVTERGNCYVASRGDDAEVPISNFVVKNARRVVDIETGLIVGLLADLKGLGQYQINLAPSNFTGSAGLQNAVAPYGGSFTGSDVHARGVYQIMLRQASEARYLVTSEGVNLVKMTHGVPDDIRGKEFLVWADRTGVLMPDEMQDRGFELTFQGYPEVSGVLKTDLAMAPNIRDYMNTCQQEMKTCFKELFQCHPAETLGKVVGWMVASHWKPLFQAAYSKFPLLHIYGAAGAGKSELTTSLLHMFYDREEPKHVTPSGTAFSFSTLVAGSASIPIVLDEYKPHRMGKEKLEQYRAVLRDAYNGKSVARGGGSRTNEKFGALNTVELSGPIAFIAEAIETETAIMERSVLVAVKRQTPILASQGLSHFLRYSSNLEPLAVIGRHMSGWVVKRWSREKLRDEFDRMHNYALNRYMMQPGDDERLKNGELTEAQYNIKLRGRPRPIFNATVSLFGIVQLKAVLKQLFPEEFDEVFAEHFKDMGNAIYTNLDMLSATSLPEYIKVLQTMVDIIKLREDSATFAIRENLEYNIVATTTDRTLFTFHVRQSYNKYRAYMRGIGMEPLYPDANAFEVALTETPQFLGYGQKTARTTGKVIQLDLDELMRAGLEAIPGKVVSL